MRDHGMPVQQWIMQGSRMSYVNCVQNDEVIDLKSDDETPDNIVERPFFNN